MTLVIKGPAVLIKKDGTKHYQFGDDDELKLDGSYTVSYFQDVESGYEIEDAFEEHGIIGEYVVIREIEDGHQELDALAVKTHHKKEELLTALIKAVVSDVDSGRVTETTSLIRWLSLEARGAVID